MACSSSRMAVSTLPKDDVTMNHDMPSTMTRNPITSPRNSRSPVSALDPTVGLAISWMPNAPRVTLRQFRNTLNEMMVKPKDTNTNISSRNRLNTTPTTSATSPASTTPTGSAAKNAQPKVGMASVRSCS